MTSSQPAKLAPYSSLDEPHLAFSASGPGGTHAHPLVGLAKLGPYTGTVLPKFTPEVRIAIVGPDSARGARRDLLRSLRETLSPTDRKDYVPTYPGFEQLFGVALTPAAAEAQLSLPERIEEIVSSSQSAHERVRAALGAAIDRLAAIRDRFDVAVFHLPDA